jgi:hypothetical protein
MSEEELLNNKKKVRARSLKILRITGILLFVVIILSAIWIKYNVYANPFIPTKLNEKEQKIFEAKLYRLRHYSQKDEIKEGRLVPEPYSEEAAGRETYITEKELNAAIAANEETARRVAIKLSEDLISVKVLVPFDVDVPLIGGKTLRLNCGITLSYKAGKPIVALRGISVGGIPIPNAWLGNIKDVNLVHKFTDEGGFWDIFSKGVEDIKILDGSLYIKLKE